MKTKAFKIILFVVLSFSTVFSQTINKPKLDSLFNVLVEKNKAMGSIVLSKNGKIVYSKAIGYAAISDKEKISATEKTKYRIGSISKMFTATMIFQLIEEGKLKLTTTVDTYFPTLPNANKITVGNLLNHRSGLHSFTEDEDYMTWMAQPKTQEEMVAIMSKSKVDFQPNDKADYSNSNFVVLGYIIEKITKQHFSKNLNERIVSKIKLSSTYVGGKADTKKNESYSYKYIANWIQQPETDMSIPGGAGAIVSTPTDITKFIEALFSFKLVSKSSLDQMKTMIDKYGMGIFEYPFGEKRSYGHTGSIDGFSSSLGYFPEDSLAFAYITNGQVYPKNDIILGVLNIYFNKEYSIPVFKSLSLKTEELDKYLGVYSSTQVPIKITVTKDNTILMAQATDQSAFPLEAIEKDIFTFDPAKIQMEFTPDKNELLMKQGAGMFLFTKEK